jgi:uncharacterized membrane protein
MGKEIRWLWVESRQWVERGLISEDQASRLRGLYPDPKAGLPWSTIIFSGLGGAIAGLGIVLLVAYNWHGLHRFTKLGVIFFGMVSLHALGLRLFLQKGRWGQFGDALCLLGSMLFGAGIWLGAQVYHIEEHFPNGFLIWGLGTLTLAWAMPSIPQGLLTVAVLCIWGCSEAWGFDRAMHWAPALVFIGGGFLAWRLRSVLLLTGTLAGFLLALSANVTAVDSSLVLRFMVSCSVTFVAVAALAKRSALFPKSARVWQFFGWTGFLTCLFLLTFPSITEQLLGWRNTDDARTTIEGALYQWLSLVSSIACWGIIAWQTRPGARTPHESEFVGIESWLLPLTAILCQILAMAHFIENKWFVAGVFNLIFLAVAAAWMARGGREGLLRPMVLGSLLLVALAAARFFDLFESLAVRGLIFLIVGAVLGTEGVLFRRARVQFQSAKAKL